MDLTPTYGKREFTPDDTLQVQVGTRLNALDSFFGEQNEAYRTGTGQALAFSAVEIFGGGDTQTLTPEEANKEFPAEGLQFSSPVTRQTAALMQLRKQQELKANDIRANSSLGVVGSFAAGLTGTMADPVDFALNFTPVGWAERFLGISSVALKGRSLLARAGIRAGQGFTAGTVGGVATGALDWAAASQEQRDYGLNEFVQNIAFGSVMGATLHVPLGAFGDAVAKGAVERKINSLLPENAQIEALKLSNQGVFNFDDILSIQPKVVEKEMQLGRTLDAADRLRVLHELPVAETKQPYKFGEEGNLSEPETIGVTPEQVAKERGDRIKTLIGDSSILSESPTVKATLTSDDIFKSTGDIEKDITSIEKETQELDKMVKDVQETQEAASKPVTEGVEPVVDHNPMIPELKDFHDEAIAQLDMADEAITNLSAREKGFRAMAACALNTVL